MSRPIGYILAVLALIVQIGMGAFPMGEWCLCMAPPPPIAATAATGNDDCCAAKLADHDDIHDAVVAAKNTMMALDCPCQQRGCDTCIRVATPDGRTTPIAKTLVTFGDGQVIAAMLHGTPEPMPVYAPPAIGAAPRATESPPHLVVVRSTRLII